MFFLGFFPAFFPPLLFSPLRTSGSASSAPLAHPLPEDGGLGPCGLLMVRLFRRRRGTGFDRHVSSMHGAHRRPRILRTRGTTSPTRTSVFRPLSIAPSTAATLLGSMSARRSAWGALYSTEACSANFFSFLPLLPHRGYPPFASLGIGPSSFCDLSPFLPKEWADITRTD